MGFINGSLACLTVLVEECTGYLFRRKTEETFEKVLILRGEGGRQNELASRTESWLSEGRSAYDVSHSCFYSVTLLLDL